MTQKIIKVGTSAGIIIPKKNLESMGFTIGDKIELDFNKKNGEILITQIKPVISHSDEEVGKIALSIINRHRKDFENLAKR